MKIIVAALVLCALSSQVQAGCTCQCVNGQMQPLCSSALDIAPPPNSTPTVLIGQNDKVFAHNHKSFRRWLPQRE
jgi:hypothetical protein